MGQYNKAILTVAGENLIARTLAGEIQLNIAKAKTSNYIYPVGTDFKSLTDMQGIKQTATDPATAVYDDTMIQTRVLFSNEAIESTYYIHNIGLYAIDGTEEVLFCIVTAETPDEMPQYNGVASTSYIYNIQNVVQDAAELNITINPSGTATIQDVLERVDATGGDISETVIETLDTIEDRYPVPAAGESVKRFFGKVLTFLRNIRPLAGNTNIYVATTGSDTTGDGSKLNPYATITKALSVIPKNINGFNCTVIVAAGIYTESVIISNFINGQLQIQLDGNITINDLTVKNASVIISSSGSTYTMVLLWLNLTERATLNSYVSVSWNIAGYKAYQGYNVSVIAEGISNLYASGIVELSGNTDVAVVATNNSRVFFYALRGSGFAVGFLTNTGGTATHASNTLMATKMYETVNGGIVARSSGAIIGTLTGDVIYYVATTGSDTAGDGSYLKPFKTIQHAIDIVPRDLNGCSATVNVIAGTYPEDVYIVAYHNGTFSLCSDTKNTLTGTCHVKSITVSRCGPGYIHINGFDLTATSRDAIQIFGSYGVHISYCQSIVTALSYVGIQISESFCNINNCKVANRYAAASFSNSNGTSAFWNSGSTGNNIGLAHTNGSMVFSVGDQPIGTIIRFQGNAGAVFYENGTQIRNITSTGLSCTWGTISGGYVRHGNMNGVAMVTVQVQIAPSHTLTAGTDYLIPGFPTNAYTSVCVTVSPQRLASNCYISTSGTLSFAPMQDLQIGDSIALNCTYITTS